MKEFLSYMKSTLLAAGQLCSARRASHCKLRLLSTARIASLALVLALCSCQDNDSPFRSVIPDDPDTAFAIRPLPMQGEEAPWDSRAVNPMSVDKENMIKQIAIFQFDAEDNLRMLKDGSGYFIYVDFTDMKKDTENRNPDHTTTVFTPAEKGYTLVTEKELPPLSTALWTSTSSDLKTCVIANVPRSMVESALFPNGKNSTPVDWINFQKTSFDLPFLTPQEVEDDKIDTGEKELGHLNDIYMFGYYEGVVPPEGFTLGLGRTVARMKVTFKTENANKIDKNGKFYAAIRSHSKTGYYFVNMSAMVPQNVSQAFLLEKDKFKLREDGQAVLQFYSGPVVNENVDGETCTQLLLWYLYPDEYGIMPDAPDTSNPEDLAKAVVIRLGNNPKNGDYGIVRNTIYSYTLPLVFNGTGIGVLYETIYTFNLNRQFGEWESVLLHDGEAYDHLEKINGTDFKWSNVAVGDIVRVNYDKTSITSDSRGKFFTHPGSWTVIKTPDSDDDDNITLTDNEDYFELEITKDIYNQISKSDNTGGLIIQCNDVKINSVEILRVGYASVKPDKDTYVFNMVWQDLAKGEWAWDVVGMRGYNDGTNDVPITLDLSSKNKVTDSDFLLDNLLNRSWTSPKPQNYGVVEYVLASVQNPKKKFALKNELDGVAQIKFDFSNLQYAPVKGNTTNPYYILDTENGKLIPLRATENPTDAQISVSIKSNYKVGEITPAKEGDASEFDIVNRTVKVNVTIADAFSHMLVPNKELQVDRPDQSIDDILAQATSFTAVKKYYGEEVKSTPVTLDQFTRQTGDNCITAVNKNGTTVSDLTGFEVENGNLEFPEDFTGTIYLHYDVKSSVASGDLVDYHYSDLMLPIKVDVIINYTDLASPDFPIKNVNFGTSGWDSNYDKDKKTINFSPNGNGSGRGWWFGDNGVDLSDYKSILIDFEKLDPSDTELQIIVEYKSGTNTSSIVSSEGPLTCEIDGTRNVKQIYITANKRATVRLTRVALGTTGGDSNNDPDPTKNGDYSFGISWLNNDKNVDEYSTWGIDEQQLQMNLSDKMRTGTDAFKLDKIFEYRWEPGAPDFIMHDNTTQNPGYDYYLRTNVSGSEVGWHHAKYDAGFEFEVTSGGEGKVKLENGFLLPLEPTNGTPVVISVTIDDDYDLKDVNNTSLNLNITNPTAKVAINIANDFSYSIGYANTSYTIGNGKTIDEVLSGIGSISATKKYKDETVKTASGISRNNQFTFETSDVTCPADVSFNGWTFTIPEGTNGNVTIQLHINSNNTNNNDLYNYKFNEDYLVLTIPVGSDNPDPDPGTDPGTTETLWSDEQNITWTDWKIDSSYFNKIFGEGDILILTLKDIQSAQLQIFTTNYYQSPTNISETIRLPALSSTDATNIKENGLGFRGEGCTLIKIEVEHPSSN